MEGSTTDTGVRVNGTFFLYTVVHRDDVGVLAVSISTDANKLRPFGVVAEHALTARSQWDTVTIECELAEED